MADLTYPLPKDTADALRAALPRCANPGLVFDRFCPDLGDVEGKEAGEIKRQALQRVAGCGYDRALLGAFRARWRALAAALKAATFEGRTAGRLVVGLGRKGPLEVGFTFHRLHGFPVIPGSALKGLARAQALAENCGNALDPDLEAVFGREPDPRRPGDRGCAGGAIFLDAVPAGEPALEPDIMNPHYPDYYRDSETAPTNWQNPNPVPFLAVGRGAGFLFAVGWRGGADRAALMRAVEWLRAGLSGPGVGAKTTAGYGCFELGDIAAPAAPEPAAPRAPSAPVAEREGEWRRGRVRVFRSDKGRGWIVDEETHRELEFEAAAIEEKGWTPASKAAVEYLVAGWDGGPRVVRVRRARPAAGQA